MFYIEVVFIALLAFIIIGPKDFPKFMQKIGYFWTHLKEINSAFQEQWEKLSYNPLEQDALPFEENFHGLQKKTDSPRKKTHKRQQKISVAEKRKKN